MNGNQLEAIREAMGIKKMDLANALNISRPTLDIRLSNPNKFDLCQVKKLCELLKIDISTFFTN